MKVCHKCSQQLPFSSFHKSNHSDGKHPFCKQCRTQILQTRNFPYNPKEYHKCSKCKKTLLKQCFNPNKRASSGCQTFCKTCRGIANKNYTNNFDSFVRKIYLHARNRSQKRKLEFSIDHDQIKQLWDTQEGRCALSGRRMTWGVATSGIQGNNDNISIDRIDSSKGYIIENIHLVTARANLMKRDYPMDVFIAMCQDVAQRAIKN